MDKLLIINLRFHMVHNEPGFSSGRLGGEHADGRRSIWNGRSQELSLGERQSLKPKVVTKTCQCGQVGMRLKEMQEPHQQHHSVLTGGQYASGDWPCQKPRLGQEKQRSNSSSIIRVKVIEKTKESSL